METFTVDLKYTAVIHKAGTDPESGDRVIEGFVATSDLDLQNDIITPDGLQEGAETLAASQSLLWNHDPNKPIGKILEAKVKGNGIWIKAVISKTADQIWGWIKEGIVSRFSIRGEALASTKAYIKGKVVQLLSKLRLVEASLVTLPANPQARLLRWYISKSFEKQFHPFETPYLREIDVLNVGKYNFEGVIKGGDLAVDIIDALEKCPTVCKDNDESQPVGVVEEASLVNDSSVYVKIRFASTSPRPEGKVYIKGSVVKSGETTLGFLPRGVWVLSSEEYTKMKKSQTLAEELKALQEKMELSLAQMADLKAKMEAEGKMSPEEEKANMPEDEEKKAEDKPEEYPEKAKKPEEVSSEEEKAESMPEDEEKKAESDKPEEYPEKAKPKEKPEPSTEADVPSAADKKDPYPAPPKQKDQAMDAIKRTFGVLARVLTKSDLGDKALELQADFEKLSEGEQEQAAIALMQKNDDDVSNLVKDLSNQVVKLREEINRMSAFQKSDPVNHQTQKDDGESDIPWTAGVIFGERTRG